MLKDPSEIDLLSRVCWLYYKQNMTQSQIGKKLSISRIKVLQLLKKAREEGMVHIDIVTPLYNCLSIEQKLISTFKLKDAMVVPTPQGGDDILRECLGKAAAQYLERHLKSGSLLGIGWGMSVAETVKFISSNEIKNVRVVTLNGGLTPIFSLNPYDVGNKFASIFEGECYHVHAPAITASERICESFKSDMTVKQALEMAHQADYVMVGIGVAGEESTLVKLRYINLSETETLRRQGAVGDILAQFFNIKGEKVDCDLHKRIVAFPIEDLRQMENVIGLAGGKVKTKAILGAIHGRFIKILITDEETAKDILDLEKENSRSNISFAVSSSVISIF
ncbi:sugar-binding transcriptional regulator, partial [Candidatus Aerophobetes bacterium]|nr:sugar-binding transcriptional regulator [Candidatus Aerophobetes bacterium]